MQAHTEEAYIETGNSIFVSFIKKILVILYKHMRSNSNLIHKRIIHS